MDHSEIDGDSRSLASRRVSRRRAVQQGGAGLAAGLAVGFGGKASAQEATPVTTASGEPLGLTHLVFENPEFDGQLLRALDTIPYSGADFGESFVTARQVVPDDEESWQTEWRATADRIYALGEKSRDAGNAVSAREAFFRAGNYYRSASIFMYKPPLDPRFVDLYERQRESFQQGAALSEWPIEVVQIPYEDTTLEGYFAVPNGTGPFPTLVCVDGYDGTKEELFFMGGAAALRRGYAILLVDGPGQGGALIEQGLYFRPDWEAVVTPQIDWLLERPEVDPKRIALMGRSWGGYLAPRAATAEHRIAALIADAAQYDPGARAMTMLPPEYRDLVTDRNIEGLNQVLAVAMQQSPFLAFAMNRGMLTFGVSSPAEFVIANLDYTIKGLADRITAPSLILEAENDVRSGDAKPLYDAIVAPKKYVLFTNAEGAGEHDEAGAALLWAQVVFDWLDETLANV